MCKKSKHQVRAHHCSVRHTDFSFLPFNLAFIYKCQPNHKNASPKKIENSFLIVEFKTVCNSINTICVLQLEPSDEKPCVSRPQICQPCLVHNYYFGVTYVTVENRYGCVRLLPCCGAIGVLSKPKDGNVSFQMFGHSLDVNLQY